MSSVGNEGQQPPQQPPEQNGQQGYYGWQYDQQAPQAGGKPQPPAAGQPPLPPPNQHSPLIPPGQQVPGYPPSYPGQQSPAQNPPAYPPPYQGQQPPAQNPADYPPPYAGQQPPPMPQYQQPIPDMGSTLGYSQGMEYQYYNASQPSQPIEVLRQARLQQLREDRMRGKQRRLQSGGTNLLQRKLLNRAASSRGAPPAPPHTPAQPMRPGAPAQFSPAPVLPPQEVSPSLMPQRIQAEGLAAASEPSQNTGLIQRVRIRRASMILTAAFIVSSILGLLRSILFSFVFGAGAISDAYFQAFLIPNTIFTMVAGGALSSAFIPVFTKYMSADKDEKTAWHVASAALNLAILAMIILAVLAMIFARQIIPLYNPPSAALSGQAYQNQIDLIVSLTRIMLLQAILLGGGVIVTSILQAQEHFLWPAVGTAAYNVGIILGLMPGLFLALAGHRNDTIAVYGATWGVVAGAALQVIIPIPALIKTGIHYTFSFDWRHPGIVQTARQMVPRIINAGMLSFSTGVDRFLISFLGAVLAAATLDGLITQYAQAFQLLQLPLTILGATIATAAFPTLAENVAKNRFDRFRATIMETLRSILFLSIPASIGLIVLGLTIIQVLFEHGAFDYTDAVLTAYPLAGFAIGLAGLSAVEILTRSFYALRDSKTPVTVSVIQFIFKIALSLVLISLVIFGAGFGTGALAFSTAVASSLEAIALLWLLQQRVGGFEIRKLARFIGQVLLASVIMGICLLLARLFLDLILSTAPSPGNPSLGAGRTFLALFKLLIEMFIGLFVYIRVARFIGIEELEPVKRVLRRFKLSWI